MTIMKIGELNMTLSEICACIPRELHIDSDVASTITETSFIISHFAAKSDFPSSSPHLFPYHLSLIPSLSPTTSPPSLPSPLFPHPQPLTVFNNSRLTHRFESMVQLGTPSVRQWLSATYCQPSTEIVSKM